MFLAQPLLSSCVSKSLQQPEINSFEAWCLQKKSVPLATRKTIDALLGQAGTEDCKLADRQLKTLTDLRFKDNQISDLKPLAGLTNLTDLLLGDNQISDLKPLASLNKLNRLLLKDNQMALPPIG